MSMIATDDHRQPDKIEAQSSNMENQTADTAVVYSDARCIDEDGTPLVPDFIEMHRPGLQPASGQIFALLADGNFIPAMSTLIRREAIVSVGGYDEQLSYEDYDMWLRLSQRFRFG